MDYCDTGCMLVRAPRTKGTMLDFYENKDLDKWDTIVWYWVTQNPHEFSRLMGCQWDPRIWGVTIFLKIIYFSYTLILWLTSRHVTHLFGSIFASKQFFSS